MGHTRRILQAVVFLICTAALIITGPQYTGLQEKEIIMTDPPETTVQTTAKITKETTKGSEIYDIILTFAGDTTLGQDEDYTWNRFDSYAENNDAGYFFEKVSSVFKNDDFTFLNLEGPLTSSDSIEPKEFNFKGDPLYVRILKEGSIEGVTLANNHILDYGTEGLEETVNVLKNNDILYTHYEDHFVIEIKDIRIAYLGYMGWSGESRSLKHLKKVVLELREEGVDYITANFHWGTEHQYYPDENQKRMAYFAIDNGVDLVIGHHPHVLQGKEIYKGKTIIYSLGNFCFGGAPHPYDYDTIIYQKKLTIKDGRITEENDVIIPARVSGTPDKNNYQPIIAEGEEAKRIQDKFDGLYGTDH